MEFLEKIRLSVKHTITHRILVPLRTLLRQGLTPSKLAWSFAVGLLIGSSPLLGFCTWICLIAASVFRLNQLAIQIANYVVYPLQVILIVPYIELGSSWFGKKAEGVTFEKLQASIEAGLIEGLKEIGVLMLQGGAAWLVVAVILVYPIQFVLEKIFSKMLTRMQHLEKAEQ
ncbi:DUF2062 domain-containing protein [Flammeovirga sp. EKP202]|uniref:DUF2062 domain-containing protein n=1 Tax=Flammeovirga sp. EKP202 TaxID=2770592 RepID=UPI00165F26BD|nr:DUF2062 domain-containing protein [Flammeovirga sp. EKP202]MBD0404795.1 DUF2062 domain-containing protein [Flammeovirga sp. EKP202]